MQLVAPQPPTIHLSQSEVADWQTCPFRAYARWHLGYRPPADESRAQRVGSIGHAILAERLLARWHQREPDERAAVEREAKRRGWSCDLSADWRDASVAAADLAKYLQVDQMHLVPNLYDGTGGPLVEVRLRAAWAMLFNIVKMQRTMVGQQPDCPALAQVFAGIEGQHDAVTMPDGPSGPVVVADWKFRQTPDLGGAAKEPDSRWPDRQASWYEALLRAVGLRPAGGIEFWQVNAYAGRMLTAEDLIGFALVGAATEEEAGLIVSGGLPTRDINRIGKVGFISPAEWAEAHRVLANLRHDVKMSEWRARGGKGSPPQILTESEQFGARKFVDELAAHPRVVVRKFRADPEVGREVVRDMLVSVDAHLAQALRGVTPARHLSNHPSSPCVRPFGCPVQSPCAASLGTFRGADLVRDAVEAWQVEREAAAE